ncbi:hypothetical protein SOVF_083540 [Spinacia oleracea]|nr:hypothetical protein SOVF_083540 [Spinacia oleracea]
MVQTEISDEDMEKVLDRTDLLVASGADDEDAKAEKFVLPLKGPGWEVFVRIGGSCKGFKYHIDTYIGALLVTMQSLFSRAPFLRYLIWIFFYKDHHHRSNFPILALAGNQDLICPPEAIYEQSR